MITSGNYVADFKKEVRENAKKIKDILVMKQEKCKRQIKKDPKKPTSHIKAMLEILEGTLDDCSSLHF
jgi:hypothetical protein